MNTTQKALQQIEHHMKQSCLLHRLEFKMLQDVFWDYRDDRGYAFYRYAISLISYKKNFPEIPAPPFYGDSSLAETLERLPERLLSRATEEILSNRKRLYSEKLSMLCYESYTSVVKELVPEALDGLPSYNELLARSYFGNYGRDGKPRYQT